MKSFKEILRNTNEGRIEVQGHEQDMIDMAEAIYSIDSAFDTIELIMASHGESNTARKFKKSADAAFKIADTFNESEFGKDY